MASGQKTPQGGNADRPVGTHMPGAPNGTKEAATKAMNAYLDGLQKKIYEAHSQLTEADEIITAESIRNKFLGKGEQPQSLMGIFKDHNQKVAALVGK